MAAKDTAAAKREPFPTELQAVPAAAPPVELPKLTEAQMKKLGEDFLRDQSATEKADAAADAARAKKSDSVKAIVEALGHKGPFNIGGRNWLAKRSSATGNYTMVEQAAAKASF